MCLSTEIAFKCPYKPGAHTLFKAWVSSHACRCSIYFHQIHLELKAQNKAPTKAHRRDSHFPSLLSVLHVSEPSLYVFLDFGSLGSNEGARDAGGRERGGGGEMKRRCRKQVREGTGRAKAT